MKKGVESYSDFISRIMPGKKIRNMARTVTFQVTEDCNLKCSYCYQINKCKNSMSFETAKKYVNLILRDELAYINTRNTQAVVFEFIGGEPMLEARLISKIINYIEDRLILLHHPWNDFHTYSICSNGTLYFTPESQQLLEEVKDNLSFSITIDGDKKLHDSCRVFPDGSPSYDMAWVAAKDWISKGYFMGSKITIAPENLSFLYEAIVHFISLGYKEINANTIYEEGWNMDHAKIYYKLLIRIADYILDNRLYETVYISLFDEEFFQPKNENDLENWCGGCGLMISCDPKGDIYPCIRYMRSSLGQTRPPLIIGNVDTGVEYTEDQRKCVTCLQSVDRRSQSNDECFYCPIAAGCSWCSAYNYQMNATVNKRVTYSCEMHKARSLANVYYWNSYYRLTCQNKRFRMYCPLEWAQSIIGVKEYKNLLSISGV